MLQSCWHLPGPLTRTGYSRKTVVVVAVVDLKNSTEPSWNYLFAW